VVLTLLTLCVVDVNDAAAQKKGAAGGAQARASSRRRQPTPAAADDRASSYLDEGQRRADAGDWAAALQAYKQATAINPRHAEAHIYVGDAYMNLGKYDDAFAAYKEAIRIAPSSAEAHYSLGEAYNYLDIHSAAVRPLVQATRLDPNYAEAHYGAGHAYLKQENFKEALVYLRRAVRLKNDYPEAHLSLGLTYLGLGQTKQAEDQLKLLEGMNPALAGELNRELRRAAATPPDADSRRGASIAAVETPTAKPQPLKAQTDGETTVASNSPRASTRKAENDAATSPQPRPAQVVPAAPPSDSPASQLAAELALWIRIKNSHDPKEFDAYLNKYPAGEFAELARIRLRALGSKSDATPPPKPDVERKQDDAITTTTDAPTKTENTTATTAAAPDVEPASPPNVEAQREPTIEETLASLKELFSNKLTYATTAPGADANVVKVTTEVFIEYEPLRFENCRIEWRDRKDTLSVALSDLDPLAVQLEPRSRPNTTFSIPVWTLTINSVGSAPAIRELKGDGSDAVVEYHSLDLQFGNKEKAEKLAQQLQQAIKLCRSVP